MQDGQVMVARGGGDYPYPTTVDFYDPVADTWTTGGALPHALYPVGAAPLQDGRVLFSPGGLVYDPSTGTTTSVPLTPGEEAHGWEFAQTALTPLPSGLVLRTGGSDDDSVLREAVLYHPATNTWSSAGTMPVPRHLHTETLLQDGRVLVVGGYTLNGDELPEGRGAHAPRPRDGRRPPGAEIYKEADDIWTAIDEPIRRGFHTATTLHDGSALITGGYDATYFVKAPGSAVI
ncbi:Kelch repeat-containing protein [Sorangium sp. So ce1000]|uniref:Kelch repeat-containing protein n=1 Tax=Sorangium sp. So ce1000 TaxID=3133325 RepID=UPI003F5F7D7A